MSSKRLRQSSHPRPPLVPSVSLPPSQRNHCRAHRSNLTFNSHQAYSGIYINEHVLSENTTAASPFFLNNKPPFLATGRQRPNAGCVCCCVHYIEYVLSFHVNPRPRQAHAFLFNKSHVSWPEDAEKCHALSLQWPEGGNGKLQASDPWLTSVRSQARGQVLEVLARGPCSPGPAGVRAAAVGRVEEALQPRLHRAPPGPAGRGSRALG